MQRMDEYLTVKQLSAALNVSRATIYRLINEGLPSVRIGHARRFPWSAVEAWVQGAYALTPEPERDDSPPTPLPPGEYHCSTCARTFWSPTPTDETRCARCATPFVLIGDVLLPGAARCSGCDVMNRVTQPAPRRVIQCGHCGRMGQLVAGG